MKKNINEFARQLIEGDVNLKEFCASLDDAQEYFEENYEGFLDSSKISTIIDISYNNKDLQYIIGGLLYCSNKDSITDEVFNKLLKFPKAMRRTVLVSLAHCDISFYQLMKINKMQICTEAFGGLMNHMYTSDAFSAEDILQLLKDSEYIKLIWKDTFKQLLSLDKKMLSQKNKLLNNLLIELN